MKRSDKDARKFVVGGCVWGSACSRVQECSDMEQ